MIAREIIQDALERINKLSPGEPLGADLLAFCFRRLNLLVDEMSAQMQFLQRDVLVSSIQSGSITLGEDSTVISTGDVYADSYADGYSGDGSSSSGTDGSWSAVAPGSKIISMTADGVPMSPITVEQYNGLYSPTQTGLPRVYAQDGLSTVYLYPVPAGSSISLQMRVGVTEFADYETVYIAAPGYKAALGAALAVRIAPTLLGSIPPTLLRAETRCLAAIARTVPAIVNVGSYAGGSCRSSILYGDN